MNARHRLRYRAGEHRWDYIIVALAQVAHDQRLRLPSPTGLADATRAGPGLDI
ncbi:hypothetical protein AFE_3256 [Acidithiobacillus ferrooxidans ATCC 23270]|uniref:Uncharacterized protein n=1 Tax=Acidithiobacillus ferrooxidans (strain ATCC 23270 / DSM 14882 / CIP 104768 / NCIMB 8455) TaxID=243159 RepID=B7JBD4_ACIF2|nr:hypothetical protein AFE_3256 [Acidithiobacillus ferrooxidans ATCC 23270]